MTRKLLLFILLLGTGLAHAQNLDISLFDDSEETPNLGRKAQPLDSVRVTPPPAPDFRISLSLPAEEQPIQFEKTTVETEATQKTQDVPVQPQKSIPLREDVVPIEIDTAPPVETDTLETPPTIPLHDVRMFDIHNFALGATMAEVVGLAKSQGYQIQLTQENMPRFYATGYAYQCRKQGALTPQQVDVCIQQMSGIQKTTYVSKIILKRKNESLEMHFTSPNTDNVLYKIIYVNRGDNSLTFTRTNVALKKARQEAFWKAIFDKYNYPDDGKKYIWGDPQDAYMKVYMNGSAYDAYMILEDVNLYNEDYWAAEDIQKERPPQHTFSF